MNRAPWYVKLKTIEFILVTPQESGEGNVDEGCSQADFSERGAHSLFVTFRDLCEREMEFRPKNLKKCASYLTLDSAVQSGMLGTVMKSLSGSSPSPDKSDRYVYNLLGLYRDCQVGGL